MILISFPSLNFDFKQLLRFNVSYFKVAANIKAQVNTESIDSMFTMGSGGNFLSIVCYSVAERCSVLWISKLYLQKETTLSLLS